MHRPVTLQACPAAYEHALLTGIALSQPCRRHCLACAACAVCLQAISCKIDALQAEHAVGSFAEAGA